MTQTQIQASAAALRERRTSWGKIFSWCMWDWGTQPFATVVTIFAFSTHISSGLLSGTGAGDGTPVFMLGVAVAVAGALIALLVPVLGQGTDHSGGRMFHLRWQTWTLAAVSAALWFVAPGQQYLWLDLTLLEIGNIVSKVVNVNYYAAIDQVATPGNIGHTSGYSWGMGYLGGIAILPLIVAVADSDIGPDGVCNLMLLCRVQTVLFTIPLFMAIKGQPVASPPPRQSPVRTYRDLIGSVTRVHRVSPHTTWFLLASALLCDGLAGVLTYGAVLVELVFGFSIGEVIIFGVMANVVAGPVTIVSGYLDDRTGPKQVILISPDALVGLGSCIFLLHDRGPVVFWISGIAMILFVGPAQPASRSFLARLIPEGYSGKVPGLYATTGRMVSFLASLLWVLPLWPGSFLIPAGESTVHLDILGIVLVLAAGLVVIIPAREAQQVMHHE